MWSSVFGIDWCLKIGNRGLSCASLHTQATPETHTRRLITTKPKNHYIDIDFEQPVIRSNQPIMIGEDNWAFRCLDAREFCEQALSGAVVFDRYQERNAKGRLETGGRFDLQFRGSDTESGSFTVDCSTPCR